MTPALKAAARLLAEADPLEAARILSAAAQLQTRGGRRALLRVFVAGLVERDPGLAGDIAADLAALSTGAS